MHIEKMSPCNLLNIYYIKGKGKVVPVLNYDAMKTLPLT